MNENEHGSNIRKTNSNEAATTPENGTKNYRDIIQDDWVDMDYVCNYLGLTRGTVLRYVRRGILPMSRIGMVPFFSAKDISQLLTNNLKNYKQDESDNNQK